MIDLARAVSAHDMGDHYLVEHPDDGMVPVFKQDLEGDALTHLEQLARSVKMADGGDVAGGQSVDPGVSADPTPADVPAPAPTPTPAPSPVAAPAAVTTISPNGTVTIQHAPDPVAQQHQALQNLANLGDLFKPPASAPETPPTPPPQGEHRDPESGYMVPNDAPEKPDQPGFLQTLLHGAPAADKEIEAAHPAAPNAPTAPAPEQAPPEPTMVAPAPARPGYGLPGPVNVDADLRHSAEAEKAAELLRAKAEGDIAARRAEYEEHKAGVIQELQASYQSELAANTARRDAIHAAIMQDIDPDRIFKRTPLWANTLSLLGLGIGTFGAALSKTPNYAMDLYQKAIERDIAAQEANQRRNLDVARLTQQERQQLLDEHKVKVADALDAVNANIQANASRGTRGLALAEAQKFGAQVDQFTAGKRAEVSLNRAKFGLEKRTADLNARAQDLALREQVWQHNLVAGPLGQPLWDTMTGQPQPGAVSTGLSPALRAAGVPPIVVPSLAQRAIRELGDYGVQITLPARDPATGRPLVDPVTGKLKPEEHYRVLQDKGDKSKVLDSVAALQRIQEPVSELAALIDENPGGALLDRAAVEKAQKLIGRIATQLPSAGADITRFTETEKELGESLAPELGIINAALGKTAVRTEQLQHALDASWRSLEPKFIPEKWVQALYQSER